MLVSSAFGGVAAMSIRRSVSLISVLLFCASLAEPQSDSLVNSINLTFTTIDVPGASLTNVAAINSNGDMVGWYVPTGSSFGHGFLLSGGNFTTLDYPGGYTTLATGINDSAVVIGYSYITAEDVKGFTYQGGVFKTIQIAGYPDTYAEGINNAGDIVGGYGFGSANGFEQLGTRFRSVTPPGGSGTVAANAINNLGQIVGWTYYNNHAGFLYQRGKYRTLNVPNSLNYTEAFGINDSGTVVGWYLGCTPTCTEHGFVLMKGKYLSFDYPGATQTYANGINNAGQIVGSYTLDGQTFHGFVTNPLSAADPDLPQ
jgi:uncharacterized membrane protein